LRDCGKTSGRGIEMKDLEKSGRIAVFKGKEIRKVIFNNEWWFSITDVIEVLTESGRVRKYWNDLKKKLTTEGYIEVSEKIGQLKLQASDGKMRLTDCANTEGIFRIIQSIPSPNPSFGKKSRK
jgi:DNA-damage-inducible protein D